MRTPVYPSFAKNIDRAEALIRIFERGRRAGRPRAEDTQLTRSSVVFSVGALDAYLHDLVLTIVAEFVPQSDTLTDTIKEMRPHDLVQTMARAATHEDAREHFRSRLDDHFDDKSFMDVGGLTRAMRLVGCASLTVEEFAAITARPSFAADLGRFTSMRHRIVHRGENLAITKQKAQDCAALVRSAVDAVDTAAFNRYYGDSPF